MSNEIVNKELGMVTAYAYAVAGGYEGTEEEFEQLLGSASIILENFENFSVTVETLPAGSTATASYADGVLNLGIPKGDKGDKGDQGETGETGATPDLSIGTVTTLNAGDDATATIGGTAEEPILNLGIPKGPSGNTGVTAELFSASKAYSAGDFVIYNDALYTFTADHAAGAWTGSDATQTTAGSEITQLKEDLTILTENEFFPYTKDTSISNTDLLTRTTETNWESVIVSCVEGDVFKVKGYGGNTTRLWMFGASDGTLLVQSNQSFHTEDYVEIVAPESAAYLCCNSKYTEIEGSLIKGLFIRDDINKLDDELGEFNTSFNFYSNVASDWVQGSNYYSVSKDSFIAVKGGMLNMYADNTTVPQDIKERGAYIVRWYDENGTNISTSTAGFNNKYSVAVPANAKTFKIEVNSGNASINVIPSTASAIKIYIGYENIFSLITTEKNFPNHYIVNMSRTVMNGGYLSDYWISYLREKKETIYSLNESIGANGFSFAFVTDLHWPSNYRKSPNVLRWLKENTPISRFVNGGDTLNEHSTLANALWYFRDWADKTNGLKVRNIRGNHDDNSMQSNTDAFLGNGRFYADMIRPIEDEVSVVDGNLYYYETIEAQKVIIFYLDTGDIVRPTLVDFDSQIAWMQRIINTLDSGWSVLVIQHIIFDGTDGSGNPAIYTFGQKTIDYLSSVTNCNVIGLIGGHTHKDYSIVTTAGFPVIVTTCDASGAQSASSGLTRTEGTVTEQALDVFTIDTTNKTINATRIGAGEDREWNY